MSRHAPSWRRPHACTRGQLQALEPVIIVIVLVVIAGIGLLFYARLSDRQGQGETAVLQEQEDLASLARIANMPELACQGAVKINCIDLYKANATAQLLANDDRARTYYYRLFGPSNITITWVDIGSGAHNLTLYASAGSKNVRASRSYFVVYDPIAHRAHFAMLTILRER